MRENRLRALLSRDQNAIGTFLNFPDAALVEFTGLSGFDWILFDAEHEHRIRIASLLISAHPPRP